MEDTAVLQLFDVWTKYSRKHMGGYLMDKYAPSVVSGIIDAIKTVDSPYKDSFVSILSGKLSRNTWCSIYGGAAICISDTHRVHPEIPDDTILIAVGEENGNAYKTFSPSECGSYLHGTLGRETARFISIDLSDLYKGNCDVMKIASMGVNISTRKKTAQQFEKCGLTPAAMPVLLDDNMVGGILLPVVNGCKGETYYYNLMGKTCEISAKDVDDVGLNSGLYIRSGNAGWERLGDLSEFLYVNEESLRNNIVMFGNRAEAERYNSPSKVYDGLVTSSKAEAVKLEKELTLTKSETSKIDNATKVETIKAKGNYEVSSIGRKDSQEITSHGRTLTLGVVACATAALGLFAKLGIDASIGGAIVSGVASSLGIISLAALFSSKKVRDVFVGIVSKSISIASTVISSAVGGCIGIVRNVIGGTCSIVGGFARGCLRIFGI